MSFDLVVRGGLVVDGTGKAGETADVGVRQGRIAAVGRLEAGGGRVLEADGCVVAPGFVDPHTHLDAQLCWDPRAMPTAAHGVTTVVLGLCGFGVAPCPAGGEEYVLRSLESVEEIPFESTWRGVPFEWGSWEEYLDYLEGRPLGLNVASFVPHSTLRYAVMGERATTEPATEEDLEQMVKDLSRALAAGGLGFSSSRGPNHTDGAGNPVPSRLAGDEELAALVGACAGRVWQINVRSKFGADLETFQAELDGYLELTRSSGSRLTWTPLHAEPHSPQWRQLVDQCEAANREGVTVAPQMGSQALPLALRFDQFSYVGAVSGWQGAFGGFFDLPAEGKLLRLADPDFRQALREAPVGTGAVLSPTFEDWHLLVSPADPAVVGRTLAEVARERRTHPVDALCDLVAADRLRTVVQVPAANRDRSAVVEMLNEREVLLGLGDAGAHVQSITNYNYPTQVLAELVRDQGVVPLARAVEHLTSKPARFLGLAGRGQIAPGMAADLTVFDLDALALEPCSLANDLPGGASRLYQTARGYVATIVNGEVAFEHGQPTAAAAGGVVRVLS